MDLAGIGMNQQGGVFSLSPKQKTYNVNPEDFIEPGMNITGGWDDKKKIVDVSGDIRDKLVSLVEKEFTTANGMSDGEERSALIRDYLKSVPAEDKLSVSYTLERIYLDEAERAQGAIQSADPGWRPGSAIDPDILASVFARGSGSGSSVDVTA